MTEEREQNERTAALLTLALTTCGNGLDEAQKEILHQHIERLCQATGGLAEFKLQNADEPDFAFRAIDRMDAV